MGLTDKVEIPRRTMVLFFMIDASGSMDGSKIASVNTAIEEVIPAIREVSDDNADALIKIAVMQFSSGAEWLTPSGPVPADQYSWDFIQAGGVTDLGEAFKELNAKLSTKGFMQEAAGSFAPAIFLLSDGDPTDDWEHHLRQLKENNWFKAASKVAVAIGDDANKDILKEFTGTMEAVLEVHNAAMLKRMIKFVSVTASRVASKSSAAGEDGAGISDAQKQAELNTALQEFAEETAAEPDNEVIW